MTVRPRDGVTGAQRAWFIADRKVVDEVIKFCLSCMKAMRGRSSVRAFICQEIYAGHKVTPPTQTQGMSTDSEYPGTR